MAAADKRPIEIRIQEKIHPTQAGCWVWGGALTTAGYPTIGMNAKTHYVHRLLYELKKGPIPDGLELDHLCKNPPCVNPDHLEPVTHKVNTLRSDGPSAVCARKTHCKNGHPLSGANLILGRRGDGRRFRVCKACNYKWQAERRH